MLAAIFGGITIYTEFFRVDTPSMIVEVLTDTNVLDVKEDVNELKVYYGAVDIKSLNQTLSVLFLRIKNNGGAPILNGYYDKKYPLNITLSEGKFLKVEQSSSTNDYLLSSAIPSIETEQKILLPEIILESGESYTIKILTIHSSESEVDLNVLGKIAGIKDIKLLKNIGEEKTASYWDQAISGDIWIQLGRLPIYFFGLIFALVLIIAPISIASDFLSKRRRKIIVNQYKVYDSNEITKHHDVVFDAYIEDGLSLLAEAKEVLANRSNLIKYLDNEKATTENSNNAAVAPVSRLVYEDMERQNISPNVYRRTRVKRLLKRMGALTKNNSDEVIVNEKIEVILGKFIDFVIIKES
jgi:hypothetical protein